MTDPTTDQDWLAERFETHRPHLRGVAYRMLGSISEADAFVKITVRGGGNRGFGRPQEQGVAIGLPDSQSRDEQAA